MTKNIIKKAAKDTNSSITTTEAVNAIKAKGPDDKVWTLEQHNIIDNAQTKDAACDKEELNDIIAGLKESITPGSRFKRPVDQEVFSSTPWQKGNTGKTKRKDYNNDFEMFYRLVDTSKKLDKYKCPEKNNLQTQYLCGGRDQPMGSPKVPADPDSRSEDIFSGSDNNVSDGYKDPSVFSNLPSVQAARKTTNRLNIAYDCEYKRIPGSEYRLITSYQFAVYLPDEKRILEVVFKSKIYDVNNRLYLRTCLGAILDLLIDIKAIDDVVTAGYKITRRWHVNETIPLFDASDDTYKIKRTYKTLDEAVHWSFNPQNTNPLVVVDSTIYKTNDFSEFRKKGAALEIAIICHAGIVDLSAFKDDFFGFRRKEGNIMPYLKSMQGGLTSIYPYFLNVPCAAKYWMFYPVNVLFRDTMCCAPADGKHLTQLGDCIGVPKIVLPKGAISHMDSYMKYCPDDYMAYAAQDALVTLMYGSRLWGINKDWPITATSGACFAIKNSIADYLNIPRDENGKISTSNFNHTYRGYMDVKKGMISTPAGLRQLTNTEPISFEAGQLHTFAASSYAGGFNTCSYPGVFKDKHTYDYDLINAYPTAMCLVYDIDFDDPIAREFINEDLNLADFKTPVDPLFALVDFEFPKTVKYPCIAIHDDGSIVFPSKAEAVYASGPSLYLALKMGAKVHVRRGYMARIKMLNDGTPSMSLRAACKQMVQDRTTAKSYYGEDSIEELLAKQFVTGSYGKIGQNVIEKNTWDGWNEHMVDIGFSAITSPERAAMITDIVRCMLIGTMNQLGDSNKATYSVTTDGFITTAEIDSVNSADCYGFRDLFKDARLWITDGADPSIWKIKHEQRILINPTTRCNIGYDIPTGKKGVLAHGGIKTSHSEYDYKCDAQTVKNYLASISDDDDFGGPEYKDSPEDKHRMAELILKRVHRVLYVSREFPNIKDLSPGGRFKDFNTFLKSHQVRLDFDLKRKPIRDSMHDVTGEIDGIPFTHVVFDTEPFETIDEYRLYRRVNETFTCLRTKTDWDLFFLKLNDRKYGYKRQTPDEWTKLMSVMQGYNAKLWSLPEVDACKNDNGKYDVKKVLEVVNSHNHSSRNFTESSYKNSRKPERASQMLPEEMIKDLLEEFHYIPNPKISKNNESNVLQD